MNTWLVLGYNISTDSYQRALIYPNADGSWGYRTSSSTDTVTRAVLRKRIPKKITNKPPSSIVIRRPTTVATTKTTTTTSTTGNTTSSTTTRRSHQPENLPSRKSFLMKGQPDNHLNRIPDRYEFQKRSNRQSHEGRQPNITATNVNVQSSTLITCTFNPPSNSTPEHGTYVITNPDGQYVQDLNRFSMRSPVGTVTTTSIFRFRGYHQRQPRHLPTGMIIPGGMRITGTDFQPELQS